MLPERKWANMSAETIAGADTSAWIAVLPLGATEQHGPHLPPDTDTIIAEGIAEAVIRQLADELPVTFMPVEPFGYSPEHSDFPSTVSLGWHQAIDRWIGIGEHLADAGIKKLVFLNAHGGNSPLMAIVSQELRIKRDMLCVASSWTRFAVPPALIDNDERALGIHGGAIETSVMLALASDKVAMDKAEEFSSAQARFASQFKHLRAYGAHGFGWKIGDLNPVGAVGDAAAGDPRTGRMLIDNAARGYIELLRDIDRFDVDQLS